MPPGEVIMRASWPSCCESVLVRSEPPCTRTTRCPSATSERICEVATPDAPPILTTIMFITCSILCSFACYRNSVGMGLAPILVPEDSGPRPDGGKSHQDGGKPHPY